LKGFAHRDIKDDNIMFDNNNIKLIDFGTSCYSTKKRELCHEIIGTYFYGAPETFNVDKNELKRISLFKYKKLDYTKFDIWSLGIVLLELILQKKMIKYYNYNSMVKYFKYKKGNFSLIELLKINFDIDPDLKKLLVGLLQLDPNKRLNASDSLKLININKMGNIKDLNKFYEDCRKI